MHAGLRRRRREQLCNLPARDVQEHDGQRGVLRLRCQQHHRRDRRGRVDGVPVLCWLHGPFRRALLRYGALPCPHMIAGLTCIENVVGRGCVCALAACPVGSFKASTGAAACTSCPSNSNTTSTAVAAATGCLCNVDLGFVGPAGGPCARTFGGLGTRTWTWAWLRTNTATGSPSLPIPCSHSGPFQFFQPSRLA